MNRNIETFHIGSTALPSKSDGSRIGSAWTSAYDTAHLEIESIAPERAHLPITETGYRSHFTSPDTVAAYGGPVAFVEAWLETESQAPDWRREEQQRRQLTLF